MMKQTSRQTPGRKPAARLLQDRNRIGVSVVTLGLLGVALFAPGMGGAPSETPGHSPPGILQTHELKIPQPKPLRVEGDAFAILEKAKTGAGFHGAHSMTVQHAVLSAMGYGARYVLVDRNLLGVLGPSLRARVVYQPAEGRGSGTALTPDVPKPAQPASLRVAFVTPATSPSHSQDTLRVMLSLSE
ncbi:MAG TPA: hypothetical protein P5186_00710 [Candidatus Paceibacterota bacterium]|nr:hypothetical protein [Verrucomicrobiota bacterium]HRY46542.1 hypothetical protein [Candidatus Paceibacterota bacterium]